MKASLTDSLTMLHTCACCDVATSGMHQHSGKALNTTHCRSQGHPVDVRIKWPNDIYGDRLKIGGILCQSAYRDQAFHVVIGAGINLSNREPTTCIDALVEAQQAKLNLPGSLPPIAREVWRTALLSISPNSSCTFKS